MRYLRMLSNSVAAACVGTSYVIVLFLNLNPALPLDPAHLVSLAKTVGLFYAVHLTAICYVFLVLRQVLAHEVFSPAWISVGVLVWLSAALSMAGAALMWRNLVTFSLVLDESTAAALERSTIVLALTATLCLVLARLRSREPDARWVWAFLLVLIVGASVAAPLAFRGPGRPPVLEARPIEAPLESTTVERSARVTVIALDAASLDLITSAAAEGRLPNFGRILDTGAVRHLATLHPTSAEAVWAAVATGKLPQKNGVRSSGLYELSGGTTVQLLPNHCFAHGLARFGFLAEQPYTSATFRTRTLWSILSVDGFSVGVVGWPLTKPAPLVRGYLVSDTYHRLAMTPSGIDDPSGVYPPELQADALAAMEAAASEVPPVVYASLVDEGRQATPERTDRIYDRIAQMLARTRPAQVTLTRYQSLDAIGHYFLRYAMPSEFGDVTDDERRRFGSVLEHHYAIIDETVGRAMAAIGPDDLLLVVSGYGMEPLGFAKRLTERAIGDPDLSGTHDAAPDGFLMAYGPMVAKGRRVQARASILDVTPTVLYFLGLPIGRDMDGFAQTDLFQRSFTDERPITFIPTYDR
jgi:predicted AlkP superfamily phosphohydrolase/phosphomutase